MKGSRSQYSSGFDPNQIPGCALWMDAADRNTLTLSGSNVTEWRDKSGNGNATTTAVGSPPLISNAINGLPAITLTTGKYFYMDPLRNPANTTTVTAFTVATLSNTSYTYGRLLSFGKLSDGTSNNDYSTVPNFIFCRENNTQAVSIFRNFPTFPVITTSVTYGTPFLMGATFDGATCFGYLNGSNFNSVASSGTFSFNRLGIGVNINNKTDPVDVYPGLVAEIIVYYAALTATQRQQVEGYLARKWGLTASFPATHPFKSIPPTLRPFAPIDAPGLAIWLDAADRNTVARPVTTWNDKSGNGYNLTAHSTYGNGTVAFSYQNGLNVLNFSGSNIYKAPTGSACYPLDCYVVIAMKSPLSKCDVMSVNTNTATDNFNSLTFGEYTALRWHNGSSGFTRTPNTVSTSNETSTNFLLMNWSIANNNYVIRRNGTQLTQTSSYTFTLSSNSIFQLGFRQSTVAAPTPDFALNAYIGEIVVYNSQLGTSSQQQVEGYLAWKWGLQGNLPAGHPYLSAAPAGFTPTQISGCRLWLDAADSATVIESGLVSTWADKSGNGVNVSTASSNPVYQTNQINGLPGIVFSGSNRLTGTYSYPTQSTVFAVCTTSNTTQAGRMIDINNNSYGNVGVPWVTASSTPAVNTDILLWLGGSNYPAQSIYTTRTPQTGVRFYSVLFNGTASQIWRNGALEALNSAGTGFAGPANGTSIAIGAGVTAISPGVDTFIGTIGEIMIFNGNLSTVQRQRVEGYLAKKWGLQATLPPAHPYYSAPPSYVFTPNQISGCALWLDAADSATLTLSGSNVTAWADKSGNGNDATQATTSNAPVLSNYNGLSAISWTATTQQLTTVSNSPTPGSSARSIFVVIHNPQSTSKFYMVTGTETGANPAIAWGYAKNANADYNYPFLYASGGYDIFTTVQITNTPTILTTVFDGTSNINGWINSAYQITKTGGINTTATPWYLGLRPSGTGSSNSLLLEVLHYNVALTTTQRQQVEGYLAAKWGLQSSLPADHPYKSSTPALSSSFVPTQVSGCRMWLDAADASSIVLTSNVTQWRDKSGNGRHAVPYSTYSGPSLTPNSLNSRPGITYNGSNQGTALASSAMPIPAALYVVGTSPGGNFLTGIPTDNANHGPYYAAFKSDLNYGVTNTGGSVFLANNTGTVVNTPYVLTGLFNGSTVTALINGGTLSNSVGFSGTPKTPATTILGLNWYNGGIAYPWMGTINEFVAFSTTPTSTQRQQMEGYLAWKWGLQAGLPGGHLYSGAAPSGFTPTDISGCTVWLDASDSSTITVAAGSNVVQWTDKSGNGRNATQSTAARQPTYSSSTAVLFTQGNSNFLTLPDNTVPSGNSPYSAYFVMTPRSTDGTFLYSGNPSNNQTNGFYFGDAFNNYWFNVDIVGGTATKGVRTLLDVVYRQNVDRVLYQNGTLQTTVASSNRASGTGSNTIGGEVGRSIYATCDINEIIIYNLSASASQRQQIEGYLAWKWGLRTNLPGPHPYQYSLPAMTGGFTPTSLSGCQLWLDAADRTTLLFQSTATLNQYVTSSTQSVSYTGTLTSLTQFTGGTSFMNGAFINSGNGLSGSLVPSATTGDWYSFCMEGGVCKVVKLRFTLSGGVLSVQALSAGYNTTNLLTTSTSAATNDTYYATYTSAPIATSSGANGYGVASFTMSISSSTGTSVIQWNDKSGNGRNATTGVAATYTASENALYFDGTNYYTTTYTSAPSAETGFVVFNDTDATLNKRVFVIGPSASGGRGYISQSSGSGNQFRVDRYAVAGYGYLNALENQRHIGGGTLSGGTGVTYVDGIGSSSYSVTFSGGGTTYIGGEVGVIEPFRGYIYECIFYNTGLTTAQRQQVEGYLAWKWKLQGTLPSNHPYRLIKP